jgi:hypothetical protein
MKFLQIILGLGSYEYSRILQIWVSFCTIEKGRIIKLDILLTFEPSPDIFTFRTCESALTFELTYLINSSLKLI